MKYKILMINIIIIIIFWEGGGNYKPLLPTHVQTPQALKKYFFALFKWIIKL